MNLNWLGTLWETKGRGDEGDWKVKRTSFHLGEINQRCWPQHKVRFTHTSPMCTVLLVQKNHRDSFCLYQHPLFTLNVFICYTVLRFFLMSWSFWIPAYMHHFFILFSLIRSLFYYLSFPECLTSSLTRVSQPEQWVWMLPSHLTGVGPYYSLGRQQRLTHMHTPRTIPPFCWLK